MTTPGDSRSSVEAFVRQAVPSDGDVLLIVPPFSDISLPGYAPHLLQALAERAGFSAAILYANLNFADLIGVELYKSITKVDFGLMGERVFSAAAYGLPLLGHGLDRLEAELRKERARNGHAVRPTEYVEAARQASAWCREVSRAVAGLRYRVVGCTTMFEQTSSSVALLRQIKALRPETTTIIGGANCEGAMAAGVASLSHAIDYVFSAESDQTFPAFLGRLVAGSPPAERVIHGQPQLDLDSLPIPSFAAYYRQMELTFPFTPGTAKLWQFDLPLESSRGCWWGEKHHCTFCGLNGLAMGFREKSADRVIQELRAVIAEYPYREPGRDRVRVAMTDNIMPHAYFRTLIPRLQQESHKPWIFYEQKANLTLERVTNLKAAGVEAIQPGIESLSTPYLRRMKKGVTAAQNVALLRYAVTADLIVSWNILTHFPGDERQELEQVMALLPLMRHLTPPNAVSPLAISRFSPYFDHADEFGLRNVRPLQDYAEAFPHGTPLSSLAYFFRADYDCASFDHPDLISALKREVDAWRRAWLAEEVCQPVLRIERSSALYRSTVSKDFVLIDTRKLPGTTPVIPLSREEAQHLLVQRRMDDTPETRRAIEHKLAVELDGHFVPLATAEPCQLLEFETSARQAARSDTRQALRSPPAVPAD